jgi:hypothetical protein
MSHLKGIVSIGKHREMEILRESEGESQMDSFGLTIFWKMPLDGARARARRKTPSSWNQLILSWS